MRKYWLAIVSSVVVGLVGAGFVIAQITNQTWTQVGPNLRPTNLNLGVQVGTSQQFTIDKSGHATTSSISVVNQLYDKNGSAGSNGSVLQTTGSATQWVATSTLGLQPAGNYVTNVTGSGNINSSGGTTPNITITGVIPVSNGGIGTTTLGSLTSGSSPNLTVIGGQNVLVGTSTSISLGSNVVTTLATGTSGTIFNGSIAANTLTLNLPFASAVNTGQLQSNDWSTFNNKLGSLNAGPNVSISSTSTISSNTFVYTVCASGCDFNGSTDVAINAALQAASTSLGTVLVKHGVYNINSNVNILSGETLMGEGYGTELIPTSTVQILLSGVSNVAVKNLRIDGTNQQNVDLNNDVALRVKNSTNVDLTGNTVTNSNGFGYFIESSNNASTTKVRVVDNYIQGRGHQDLIGGGIENTGSNSSTSDVTIIGNTLVQDISTGGTYTTAYDMTGIDGITFCSNNVQGNVVFGFEQSPDNNSQICNNIVRPSKGFNGSGAGNAQIVIQQSTTASTTTSTVDSILGNIITGGRIFVKGNSSAHIQNVVVSGNNIRSAAGNDFGQDGIDFQYVDNAQITSNTLIEGTTTSAIGINLSTSTNVQTGENVIDNFNTGIALGGTSNSSQQDVFTGVSTDITGGGASTYANATGFGIGTTNPQGELQVVSSVNGAQDWGQITASDGTNQNLGVTIYYDHTNDRGVISARNAGVIGKDLFIGSPFDNNALLIQHGTGNLGIGTLSPNFKLEVNGTASTTALNVVGNINDATLTASSLVKTDASKNLQSATLGTGLSFSGNTLNASNAFTGSGINGQVAYWTSATALTSASDLLNNGTVVGVNATSSTVNLLVQGTANNTPFQVNSSSATSLLTVLPNGNVGIGTSNPLTLLQVSGNVLGAQDQGQIVASDGTNNNLGITMYYDHTNDRGVLYARNAGVIGKDVYIGSPFDGNAELVQHSTGNVGIGTLSPNFKLEVNGTASTTALKVVGNITDATLTASSLVMTDASKDLQSVTLGTGLSLSGTTLSATGGGGGGGGGWATSSPNIISTTFPSSSTAIVGINSSTPIANLSVVGISGSSTPIFVVASSTNAQIFKVNFDNNVFFPQQTTNGFMKFTGGTGQLGVDTNTYLTTVSANSPLGGNGTGGSPLTCATCVTSVSGSGSVLSSGGTTPTIQLQNLTARDILYGQGTNTFATSSNLQFLNTNTLAVTGTTTVSNGLLVGLTTFATPFINGQTLVGAQASTTNYIEFNLQNQSASSVASSDYVLTADNGSATNYYTDMFQNSSNFTNTGGISGGKDDGGLSSSDASLYLGTASTTNANANIYLVSQGTQIATGTKSGLTISNATTTTLFLTGLTSQNCIGTSGTGLLQAGTCPNYWTTTTNGIFNNSGYEVGINSTTPTANLVVEGSSTAPTLNQFTVASSSNVSDFTIASGGDITFTGHMLGPQGTQGAPTYSAANASNAGLFFPTGGNGNVSLVANGGVEALTVRADTSQIVSTANGTAAAPIFAAGPSDTDGIFMATGKNVLGISSNGIERARFQGDGFAGVNSSTPIGTFVIRAYSGSTTPILVIASSTNQSAFTVNGDTTATFNTSYTTASGATASILSIAPTVNISTNTIDNLLAVQPVFSSTASQTPATAVYMQNTLPTVQLLNATTTISKFYASYSGLTFSTGTITSYYGMYIDAPTVTASTTLTNDYGIVIAPSSSTTKYTLLNGIGTTTPTATLMLQGQSGQTQDLLDVASSTGSNIFSLSANNTGSLTIASSTMTSSIAAPATLSVWGSGTLPMFIIASSSNATIYEMDASGHEWTGGTAPTCGTGCSSITGDDDTMRVVTGSGVTAVTVNFATTWINPKTNVAISPACTSSDESGGTTTSDASSTPTSVTANLSASLTSKNLVIKCRGSLNFTQ